MLILLAISGGGFSLLGLSLSSAVPTPTQTAIHPVVGGTPLPHRAPRKTPGNPCTLAEAEPNPVLASNIACPGSDAWRVDAPVAPAGTLDAFPVPASVETGSDVKLYITSIAPSVSFQIYRLGWYGGHGGYLVYSSPSLPGILQPAPTIDPSTREVSCANWVHPVTVHVPTSWVSGVYLVKLYASYGYIRYTLFVVRQDASRAAIVFEVSLLTYQAYNNWGGYSLYGGSSSPFLPFDRTRRAYVVSFDRPYGPGDGLSDFPRRDLNLLRWLERSGYDLTYATDVDTDLQTSGLARHRLAVFGGHDEYWSTAMRQHVEAARDAGVSLAFFTANNVYWHIRLLPSPFGSGRRVVCYRVASLDPLTARDPSQATVLWRTKPLSKPENSLLGEMYAGIAARPAPLRLAPGALPFLAGTGLHPGSALPGLVDGEFDRVFHNRFMPPGLIVLATSPVSCKEGCPSSGEDVAQATLYVAPSGAKVFDAGTFVWSWGLDDEQGEPTLVAHAESSPGFQHLTQNLLNYLLASPVASDR
jgi:hypothetical protein